MDKPVRMKDIAQKLGISVSTVSRVMNDETCGLISDDMIKKVRFTAFTMGYKKNLVAGALKNGKTYIIDMQMSLHYDSLCDHFMDISLNTPYQLLFRDVEARYVRDKQIFNTVSDGIISNSEGFLCEELMKGVGHNKCVSMGHHCSRKFDHIYTEYYGAMRDAMEYLIKTGCRKIAYLTDDYMDFSRETKCKAYTDVLNEAGLPPLYINTKTYDFEDIYRYVKEFFVNGNEADAIFCHASVRTDPTVMALKELGIKIPEDISIVTTDYKPNMRVLGCEFSSLDFDEYAYCKTAWDFLMNRIENPDLPIQSATVDYKFYPRQSTGS
ncbi:MAG: LacI family DNA-binding transcriptional regulator [Armatimonadetes bacterium]|nr:LacI family DNA-binding transcriptional regulator [Candidatus Hippobium faecium]